MARQNILYRLTLTKLDIIGLQWCTCMKNFNFKFVFNTIYTKANFHSKIIL